MPLDTNSVLLQRVAQHEIAHYVAAKAMGFRTSKVTIQFSETGHHGQAHVDLDERCSTLDHIIQYAKRRMIVVMAGSIGEALLEDTTPSRIETDEAKRVFLGPNTGTDADKACAIEHMQLLHNIQDPETQNTGDILNQLWNQAIAVVYLNADLISELAKCLIATVRKEENVYQLELTDSQIASILKGRVIPRLDGRLEFICDEAKAQFGDF